MSVRYLFVNDSADTLRHLRRWFHGHGSTAFFLCKSTDEVLRLVDTYHPEVLFLDHALTPGGNEGFEVVAQLKDTGVTIVCISDDSSVAFIHAYLELGIQCIDPGEAEMLVRFVTARDNAR